ncbi:hypothetical protein B0H13DRAFT_2270035, partial [Mycena leptocephala]
MLRHRTASSCWPEPIHNVLEARKILPAEKKPIFGNEEDTSNLPPIATLDRRTVMNSFHLLALFMAFLSVGAKGQLFLNIVEGDSLTVQQCGQVGIEFGGGYPPYSFYVWSYYAWAYTSSAGMDSSGKATWIIREAPSSVLYLSLVDSLGTYVVSHYFQVLPGTADCGSSAEFERADEGPVSTITSPSPTHIPASPTQTAPPSTTTTGIPSLDDCISKKASCAFTAT